MIAWSEVLSFDRARGCAKCRGISQAFIYFHRSGQDDLLRYAGEKQRLEGKLCAGLDDGHHHRVCRDCGYEWLERTADAGSIPL